MEPDLEFRFFSTKQFSLASVLCLVAIGVDAITRPSSNLRYATGVLWVVVAFLVLNLTMRNWRGDRATSVITALVGLVFLIIGFSHFL